MSGKFGLVIYVIILSVYIYVCCMCMERYLVIYSNEFWTYSRGRELMLENNCAYDSLRKQNHFGEFTVCNTRPPTV